MAGLPERDAQAGHEIEERNEAKRARFFGDVRELRAIDLAQQKPRFEDLKARHGNREAAIPGLGPTFAERAAQRSHDAEQAQHLPERRETDRMPVVGQPEPMSDATNARLFPTGPGNDDNER
jgi:hypothetical protein